jgi:hypothetical protein
MLSVTCTQCNARYTMSEELYRRKGGGQAVIVTCKRCKAEIRFDAAEAAKGAVSVSKALEGEDEPGPFVALSSGFFGPELGSSRSSESSLPSPKLPEVERSPDSVIDSASVQPVRVSSPAASKPEVSKLAASRPSPDKPASERSASGKASAAKAPGLLDDDEITSVRSTDMLDETETVPLVTSKQPSTGTHRRLPAPPPRKKDGVHEPVSPPRRTVEEEVESAPPSSSGTPTLTTLMGESTASVSSKQPSNSKKPDDFLLNLRASPETLLGPPTIDLTTVGPPNVAPKESEPPPASESESAPSTLGSVAPSAKKKRSAETRSDAPSAEAKRNQPSAASAPVAKPAEQREAPQRPIGLWLGVLALVGLAIGAVLFKSPKKEQVTEQAEPPVSQPSVPAEQAERARPSEAPAASVSAEPAATASALPEPAPSVAEKKPEKPAEPKPSEASPSAPAAEPKPTEAKPAEVKPAAEAKPEDAKPAAEAASKPAEPAAAEPPPAQHGPFQPEAAKAALNEAAAQAAVCRKGDDPSGSATVIITFAPSGRVTSATLNGPPFAGTATGGCIASTMRRARVPPFDGDKITVSKTIYVQ